MKTVIVIVSALAAAPAAAAGNGAGAGGAGHQRAINTGMVAGEKGPPGAPNNPRPTPASGDGIKRPTPEAKAPSR